MIFDGIQRLQQQISEKALTGNVFITSSSEKPDMIFWPAVMKNHHSTMMCIEKDVCVLVEQGLSSDGRTEQTLFTFNDEKYIIYGIDPAGEE